MKPIHAIALFLAYIISAMIGLSLTTVSSFATAIWPATGVAIIGILLGGEKMAVIIATAALVVNYYVSRSYFVSSGLAIGNALEAVIAVRMLNSIPKFDWSFGNANQVVSFLLRVGFLATTTAPLIGTIVLTINGNILIGEILETFTAWWLGDSLGVLVVVPFFMIATKFIPQRMHLLKSIEFAVAIFLCTLICLYLFVDLSFWSHINPFILRRVYLLYPILIWSALRFGPPGISAVNLIVAVFSSYSSSLQVGYFHAHATDDSLFAMQAFLGITNFTGLVTASAVTQFQRSETRFRSIFQMAGLPMAQVDLLGNFVLVNDQFCTMTGYSREELLAKNFPDLTHPDDVQPNANLFERLVSGQDLDLHFEKRYILKKGDIIWVLVDAKLLNTEALEPTIISIIQDITTRKLAEQATERAQKLAEESNRAKSRFLANMSHEIRTPLGVILGFAELLKDQKITGETRSEFTDTIHRNALELGELIDDMLDISKVEAGKIEIETEPVRIDNLLRDLRDSFTAQASSKGLTFSVVMDESTPVVIWSDHTRLRQILINIIGNAVKFTSRGAVSLHVAGKIRAIDQRRAVSFVVKDTGIGLSKEESEQLFQPFIQIRRAGTKKTPGTGLGLVLARQLARLLGGDISLVESQPEKGSTFEITIDPGPPLIGRSKSKIQEESGTVTGLQETISNRLDGLKILLAEDTPDQALLIQFFLKDLGAKVETVENGADAVNRSLANNFDLILMDMQMPILSGIDATQLLRRRGFIKPIVALTAQAMKEDQEKCLASGCTAHLAKPFTQENLIKTIRGCFRPRETPPESHLH